MSRLELLFPMALIVGSLSTCAPEGVRSADVADVAPGLTITRDAISPVAIRTIPNAACRLTTLDAPESVPGLPVSSDSDGVARFQLRPDSLAGDHEDLRLRCSDASGLKTDTQVRVTVGERGDPTLQALYESSRGASRPAVERDPRTLSQAEIAARGLPPRPDPTSAPEAYAVWTTIVTMPMRRIAQSGTPPNANIFDVNQTDSVWSGVAAITGSYAAVGATWNVPTVIPDPSLANNQCDAISVWVGIDGDNLGNHDLIQDGTHSLYCKAGAMTTYTYDAWIETIGQMTGGQPTGAVSQFTVNPGDLLFAETWECTAGANGSWSINLSGTSGCFYVADITRAVESLQEVATPVNTCGTSHNQTCTVTGASAEWIVERPFRTVGGVPTQTDFGKFNSTGSMSISNTFATRTVSGELPNVTFDSQSNQVITLINGSTTALSTPDASSPPNITFTWGGYH
jgi:hypothetical protein